MNDERIVLVDLDDTLIKHDQEDGDGCDVSHFGSLKKYARKMMELLEEMEYIVVIWTTRGNNEEIANFLDEKNIPYDYVNWHPYQPEDASPKLYADLIIDDRALGCPSDCRDIFMALQMQREYEQKGGILKDE